MPVTPAVVFGIMSRKVTITGAFVSVLAGIGIAAVYVADQLLGEMGASIFPFLHHDLTFNYTYRGLWGTLIVTAVLFTVSMFTAKTSDDKLEKTTIKWDGKIESFRGLKDWRLYIAVLTIVTVFLYAWLW